MEPHDFESWFTLLSGFAIFIMGMKVYWLDANNRLYQAFMVTTFFLFIQNFLFFFIIQTKDVVEVQELRRWQEAVKYIAISSIAVSSYFYAQQFCSRPLTQREKWGYNTILFLSVYFVLMQIFSPYVYGETVLNADNDWVLVINKLSGFDKFRIFWIFLLCAVPIYFSYLPFKHAPSPSSRWPRFFLFSVITLVLSSLFIKNYILVSFFQIPSIVNKGTIIILGVFLCRILVNYLKINDLNSSYIIPNLLKNMTNWFVLTDSNFNIKKTNTAFLNQMGKKNSYWANYSIYSLFDTDEWEKCKKKITLLENKESLEWEFIIKQNDQNYYLNFAITPVFSQFRLHFFGLKKIRAYAFVGTNLSEFKASENKAKAYAKELESSIHSLESFAFVASHDLKSPIRNIIGFAGLLRRHLGDNITVDKKEYLDYIDESVKSMNQLVNSIMAISKIGRYGLNFELIDMNKLLNQKQNECQKMIHQTNAQLNINELPLIHGDAQLINQLFENIIENSLKYNTSDQANIWIYSTYSTENDQVLIKIEDNGIGIEKEYRQQVFEMFKRLHSRKNYTGTGIGLAICKRIMELHYGEIWIEDAKNDTGVTFVLSFPPENNIKNLNT